jgi:hypothetical protein
MQKVRFTLATLAFLGCVLVLALWLRSYFSADVFQYPIERPPFYTLLSLSSSKSAIVFRSMRLEAYEQYVFAVAWYREDPWHPREWKESGDVLGFGMAHGEEPFVKSVAVWIPHWFLAALFALIGFWFHRRWRKNRPAMKGFCPVCGYDLRATPDQCPECGHETKSQEANLKAEGAGAVGD